MHYEMVQPTQHAAQCTVYMADATALDTSLAGVALLHISRCSNVALLHLAYHITRSTDIFLSSNRSFHLTSPSNRNCG